MKFHQKIIQKRLIQKRLTKHNGVTHICVLFFTVDLFVEMADIEKRERDIEVLRDEIVMLMDENKGYEEQLQERTMSKNFSKETIDWISTKEKQIETKEIQILAKEQQIVAKEQQITELIKKQGNSAASTEEKRIEAKEKQILEKEKQITELIKNLGKLAASSDSL